VVKVVRQQEMSSDDRTGGMVDVADKPDTLRTATAKAVVKASPPTLALVEKGRIPKGNVLDAARIAATMGAKRTWDLLPYCHPVPIDSVQVGFAVQEKAIEITVEVKSIWKTGVEMEALTGATIAALTIYDMLKPVDKALAIESILLVQKSGGIKRTVAPGLNLSAAVLVASDSRKKADDRSGKIIIDRLARNGFKVTSYRIMPDNISKIGTELRMLCDKLHVDLVVTTGGTGASSRDVTPEATRSVLDKELAGVSETLRAYGQKRTLTSMLSRGVAGIRGKTVIVNLPGSPRAVSESLDALFPGILHVFGMLDGQGHEDQGR